MAIHDVDKGSDGRSVPSVNTSDVLAQRKSEGTNGVQNRAAFKTGQLQSVGTLLDTPQSAIVSVTGTDTIGWTAVPHHLTYTPDVRGYIDKANFSSITVNNTGRLLLPTIVGADLSGATVSITAYVTIFADDTNINIVALKGTSGGNVGPITVTYFVEKGILS